METPTIKVKYSFNKELRQFLRALHNDKLPWLRGLLFKVFPELEVLLKNCSSSSEEEKIVKNFIIRFRKKHQKAINYIVKNVESIFSRKSKKALKELASLMDYQWPKGFSEYIAIPTILPHSPFEKDTYYFSVLEQVYNNKCDALDIFRLSIHEISHIILFDIFRKNKNELNFNELDWLTSHYLKEILAPVLMNQKALSGLLEINDYLGNPDLHYIFILSNHKKIQICKYFQTIYEQMRYKEKKNFIEILRTMIQVCILIKPELEKRYKLWNLYGLEIMNKKQFLKEYAKPIKLALFDKDK